jgi:hypothetical protein
MTSSCTKTLAEQLSLARLKLRKWPCLKPRPTVFGFQHLYTLKASGDITATQNKPLTPKELADYLTDLANDIMNGKVKISKHSEIVIDVDQAEK